MDKTFKAFSILLSYPSAQLQQAIPEISLLLAQDIRLKNSGALNTFLSYIQNNDCYLLEENYINLFDRNKTLSLNLFEHIHSESPERGGAMLSLLESYQNAGFEFVSAELPDHLPVLLEFLSLQKAKEAKSTLADVAVILQTLKIRLEQKQSEYAAIFEALIHLADIKVEQLDCKHLLNEKEYDEADLDALDALWQEQEVQFSFQNKNCNSPQTTSRFTKNQQISVTELSSE